MVRMVLEPINTHVWTASILDAIDDVLKKYGAVVPSDEDGEKDQANDAVLYGSTYGEMSETIECLLIAMLDDAMCERPVESWTF